MCIGQRARQVILYLKFRVENTPIKNKIKLKLIFFKKNLLIYKKIKNLSIIDY
jgi:hypothetical protein